MQIGISNMVRDQNHRITTMGGHVGGHVAPQTNLAFTASHRPRGSIQLAHESKVRQQSCTMSLPELAKLALKNKAGSARTLRRRRSSTSSKHGESSELGDTEDEDEQELAKKNCVFDPNSSFRKLCSHSIRLLRTALHCTAPRRTRTRTHSHSHTHTHTHTYTAYRTEVKPQAQAEHKEN